MQVELVSSRVHFDPKYLHLESRPLASGAFGSVYKASYLGATLAVKKIPLLEEEIFYLKRELNLLASLSHPNIVSFFDFHQTEKHIYILMEYVEQGDLHNILRSEVALSWQVRTKWALDIASALAFLHSRDIIHRDLKSKNILIQGSIAKLCDFGLARSLCRQPKGELMLSMTQCGTSDWMAPEVSLGMEYNQSVDVFSFGLILLELITRKTVGEDLCRCPQECFGIDEERTRLIIPLDCPPQLSQLAFECCQYEPASRPDFNSIISSLSALNSHLRSVSTIKAMSTVRAATRPS